MHPTRYDDIVVGAGIAGLATTVALVERGRRVLVLDRARRTEGATVRNFGMVWPVGQPSGPMRDLALASRDRWLRVLQTVGAWHDPCGSLHLAEDTEEQAFLERFVDEGHATEGARMWTPDETLARSPLLRPGSFVAALYSPTEVCVDPREVPGRLIAWLSEHGADFAWDEGALDVETERVRTAHRSVHAERVWVCTGDTLGGLFAETLRDSGAVRCKLQMLRAAAPADRPRMGPMLAAGLTLGHYGSFRRVSGWEAIRDRLAERWPEHVRLGIHVMASQHGTGEITIGDSHEYHDAIPLFDSPAIDDLILSYLRRFLPVPDATIRARWHGTYLKHPTDPWVLARPMDGVTLMTGLGGAGMTLSFGWTARVVEETLGSAT